MAETGPGRVPWGRGAAAALLGLAGWSVLSFPVAPLWLGVGLAVYGALVWVRPESWLVAVPAMLPLLDLSRWTGRFYFDAFDRALLVTVAVLLVRAGGRTGRLGRWAAGATGAAAVSYAVSAALGLLPWQAPDGNAFTHYYSHFNALRVAKGFAWALLLLPFLARVPGGRPRALRLFSAGMVVGLAGVCAFVGVERVLFPGLWNFSSDFRVTGPFWSMHVGGQHIDAFLAAALPFAVLPFASPGGLAGLVLGAGVFGAGAYAVLVTFSRATYAACVLAFLVLGIGAAFRRGSNVRRVRGVLVGAIVVAVAAGIAAPVLGGSFARQRFARLEDDLRTRLAHWKGALALRDPGWRAAAFGMGLGTYPRLYAERNRDGMVPYRFRYETEGGNTFIRLRSGDYLYMGQPVRPSPGETYRLGFDARSSSPRAALTVPICEKALLYSFRCSWNRFLLTPDGRWHRYERVVDLGGLGAPLGRRLGPLSRRPVEFAFFAPQPGSTVDVDNLSLVGADGRDLVVNGDFSRGGDRWFFTTDNHLAWHTKSLAVHLLVEQGWLGLAAVASLVLGAVGALIRRLREGEPSAPVLLSSLAGFLAVGAWGTLLDTPRLALLFFLLVFLSFLRPLTPEPPPRAPGR
ncbi:MAG: hypothetical protein Kow0092_26620 [Deferrisomatales bacterium]